MEKNIQVRITSQEKLEIALDLLIRLGYRAKSGVYGTGLIDERGFINPNRRYWNNYYAGLYIYLSPDFEEDKEYQLCATDYSSHPSWKDETENKTYIQFLKWANAELRKPKKAKIKKASELKTFGFEIECETLPKSYELLTDMGEVKGDGSIETCNHDYRGDREWHRKNDTLDKEWEEVELATNVFKISEMDKVEKFFKELQALHKEGLYHWNPSMGFHIHLGFSPKKPPELISLQFVKHFLKEVKKEFPAEYALRKGNRYCRLKVSEKELATLSGERYKAVNISGAMESHGTIEIRLFPSEEPIKMLKYLKFTLELVKDFLKKEMKQRIVAYNVAQKEDRVYLGEGDSRTEKVSFTAEIKELEKVIFSI